MHTYRLTVCSFPIPPCFPPRFVAVAAVPELVRAPAHMYVRACCHCSLSAASLLLSHCYCYLLLLLRCLLLLPSACYCPATAATALRPPCAPAMPSRVALVPGPRPAAARAVPNHGRSARPRPRLAPYHAPSRRPHDARLHTAYGLSLQLLFCSVACTAHYCYFFLLLHTEPPSTPVRACV